MKKRILILAILFCSMTFSATTLAEDEKLVIIPGNNALPLPLGYQPVTSSDRFEITLLFDTLTWKDANGVIPALANGWRVSDDGKTWTFYLNKDVRWHDGEPFTADDVKFTFDYMKDYPGYSHTWFELIEHVDSVDVVDDYTVVIHLDKLVLSFLVDTAGSIPIIPEHIWKDISPPTPPDDAGFIGTGPMKIVEFRLYGDRIYEANNDYFNGKLIVDKFIPLRSAGTAMDVAKLCRGDVAAVSLRGSDIDAVNQFVGDPDFEIITGPSYWALKVHFNCEKYPTNITKFRHAVAYGIDREELVRQKLHGGGVVANTGIMHHDSIWYNPDCEGYAHDVDEANAILDSLGFADTDGDGIREYPAGAEKSGDLKFTLYVMHDCIRYAELIHYQLEEIGIKIRVEVTGAIDISWPVGAGSADVAVDDPLTVCMQLQEGDFNMLLFGHGELVNPRVMNWPDWPANTYQNEEYTSLFEESEATVDLEGRKELLHQLQEIIADDLPVYMLYNPYHWCVYNPDILDTWFYTKDGVSTGRPTELNKLAFIARYGDANENGKLNMQDVTLIERTLCGTEDPTEMADANQDGRINMADVTCVELTVLGRAPIRCE